MTNITSSYMRHSPGSSDPHLSLLPYTQCSCQLPDHNECRRTCTFRNWLYICRAAGCLGKARLARAKERLRACFTGQEDRATSQSVKTAICNCASATSDKSSSNREVKPEPSKSKSSEIQSRIRYELVPQTNTSATRTNIVHLALARSTCSHSVES